MASDRWWGPLWIALRTRWAILGAIVFLPVNYLLYLTEHPWWTEGFTGHAAGSLTPILLAIAFFVLLFAVIGWRGRSFSTGFATALLVLTVTSMGSCTRHWLDPVDYLRVYSRQELNRTAYRAKQSERDIKWADSIRANGITRSWGAKRVLLIRMCMEMFARRDSTTRVLPPDSVTITNVGGGCRDWDAYEGRGRSGWHWRYTPPSGGGTFLLEGYPEPVLGLDGPLYELDESGLLIQRERAGASRMLVVSPIAVMRQLRECAEYMLALPRPPGAAASVPLTLEDIRTRDGSPCAGLGNIPSSGVSGGDRNAVRVYLPQGVPPKESVMNYTLIYAPRGGASRGFDIHARPPFYPGTAVRSYLLTGAGALHVTAEERAATTDDPAPKSCEVDVAVECPSI